MYVYLIYDTNSKLTKIGKSIDPIKRLQCIKCGNPSANLFYLTDKHTEKELHKKYDHLRFAGEWFRLGVNELKEIMGNDGHVPKTFFYRSTKKKLEQSAFGSRILELKHGLVWQLKGDEHYKFTSKGICINTHRGKLVRRTLNGSTSGYCINGRFMSDKQLRPQLERIPEIDCPF